MKTNYYVNAEKGVVICKIKSEWQDEFKYELTGRADCSPDDVFDEQIGKRIAELRAHIVLHAESIPMLKAKQKRYSDAAVATSREVQRHQSLVDRMKSQIKEITK